MIANLKSYGILILLLAVTKCGSNTVSSLETPYKITVTNNLFLEGNLPVNVDVRIDHISAGTLNSGESKTFFVEMGIREVSVHHGLFGLERLNIRMEGESDIAHLELSGPQSLEFKVNFRCLDCDD